MSHYTNAVNFSALVNEVITPAQWKGEGDFAVWGGRCAESALHTLLTDWNIPNAGMNYVICEFMDRIIFFDGQAADVKLTKDMIAELERGRIFGANGDLSVWRDGDQFHWRFVGEAGMQPPAPFNKDANNFWRTAPDAKAAKFLVREESALLWGERKGKEGEPSEVEPKQVQQMGTGKREPKRWFEDRVARAKLEYPIDVYGRVKICYWTFSRAGRIEFVWFKRLEAA